MKRETESKGMTSSEQLATWLRAEGAGPADDANELAEIVSRVYRAWFGEDEWVPFSFRYAIAYEIQRAGFVKSQPGGTA